MRLSNSPEVVGAPVAGDKDQNIGQQSPGRSGQGGTGGQQAGQHAGGQQSGGQKGTRNVDDDEDDIGAEKAEVRFVAARIAS